MDAEIYDPFDYQTHKDPYPIYKTLRDHFPAYHNRRFDFWALSRYEDCQNAARNFRLFSSACGTTLEPMQGDAQLEPILINADPPIHTRLRHLIGALFTPAKVAHLEELVRDYARRLLAPARERGQFDLIADFAAKLPMAIISRLLGFPAEDEDMVRTWTDQCIHREDGVFEMPEEGVKATMSLYGYFEEQLASRAKARRDDIVQILADAEQSKAMSHGEVLGYLYILSIAGNETTTKLIGNMAWQLQQHPQALARVRANRSLLAQTVEETLRFDGPTHMMARTITQDLSLHGEVIPAGAKVALLFMSANHDERKFPHADHYDIDRNPRDHLAFGGGIHACLGAALARLEAKLAWDELLNLMQDYEIDVSGIKRAHSPQVRGFTALPCRILN